MVEFDPLLLLRVFWDAGIAICAPKFLHPMVAPATKASVLDFVWDNISSLDKVVEVMLSSDFKSRQIYDC